MKQFEVLVEFQMKDGRSYPIKIIIDGNDKKHVMKQLEGMQLMLNGVKEM